MNSSDYDKGMVNRRRLLGDAWVDKSRAGSNAFNEEFQDLITRYAWNEVWGRPAFGDKTRRLMVLSTMIALKAYVSSKRKHPHGGHSNANDQRWETTQLSGHP